MVRALSLAPLAFIVACSVDLGIEEMRYRCENDSQCAIGFFCDRDLRICSEPSDAGARDSGVEPCGFDEDFSALAPAGWQRNGNVAWFPGFVQLTPVETGRRGSVWYLERIQAERFTFEVVFNIFGGGDMGGDGMAIAWIEEDASARGGTGGNLGVYGLNGYLVEVDTFGSGSSLVEPQVEHIAFARTHGEFFPDAETFGVASDLPSLRGRTERTLRLEFDLGVAQIYLDGTKVLTATAASYEPFRATFGATASTGGRFDSHTVHRLTLTCR